MFYLFKRIDVLRVVPEQLILLFKVANESVAGGGLELARVDLAGKLEERARVPPEIVDVEHRLGKT